MEETPLSAAELEKDLNAIEKQGISADRKKLKQDMCAQFSDFREWAREYVVNAFDAMAAHCKISGQEGEETLTIRVEDNGHGMDKQGIMDYFTLFRSIKYGDPAKTIGCHGAGKLSVAAIPDQSGFFMKTSTGKECWQLKTGSLLDDDPVTIHRVDSVPAQGTLFEITFKKTMPLSEELAKLKGVLEKYCRYLPLDIIILGKISDSLNDSSSVHWIKGDWNFGPEMMPVTYQVEEYDKSYEVIMGMGSGKHSVYQNRVLISTGYNLLSQDTGRSMSLPYLDIRINSQDFKPTFGRNRLTNESFLGQIFTNLKRNLIPKYFTMLTDKYHSGLLSDFDIEVSRIETLACSIINHSPHWISSAARLPMFRVKNGHSLSFDDLRQCVIKKNLLYLENQDSSGIDFSVFDAPVISLKQPVGGLEFIRKHFSTSLTNLGLNDVVIEAPQGSCNKLGPKEMAFENYLGFHPDALNYGFQTSINNNSTDFTSELSFKLKDKGFLDTLCEESREAQTELKNIEWKVNYLVDRDGKTPNKTHRFLLKGDLIILNLNHEEIQKLLRLSISAPALAGHWAMAICLSETNNILKHLTPEAREDLLLIDAMARCGSNYQPRKKRGRNNKDQDSSYEDDKWFELELENIDLWL
ncbi:MAG: ATP-binding protein [Desulfobacteraceae bacterium]|nr:ATP-binding protein [Desulfobacteraceae bacterium]